MSRDSSHLRSASAYSAVIPLPQDLALPDGAIGDQTAELMQDLVNPHHHSEATLIAEEPVYNEDEWSGLPWWGRPNAMW